MKLNGVMIGSENPTKLAEFYTELLGNPGWQQDDWYGYGTSADGALMIGPHSAVKGSSKEPARIMFTFVSSDVKADFNRAKAITGATVVAEPYLPDEKGAPDMWLSTLADPEGNYFQIVSPWED